METRKSNAPAEDGADVLVRALTPILHDGEAFCAGDTLRLTPAQASALLVQGYAELARRDPDELTLA